MHVLLYAEDKLSEDYRLAHGSSTRLRLQGHFPTDATRAHVPTFPASYVSHLLSEKTELKRLIPWKHLVLWVTLSSRLTVEALRRHSWEEAESCSDWGTGLQPVGLCRTAWC